MSEENNKKKKIEHAVVELEEKSLQEISAEFNNQIAKNAGKDLGTDIMKSLINNAVGSASKKKAPRLAFAEDPQSYDSYAGIYKTKKSLLPNNVLKQLRVQNFLIAAILRARGNTISMMGHLRKDRFDVGIELVIKPEFKDFIEPEQMIKIRQRMDETAKLLINCGQNAGLTEDQKMHLPEFLDLQTKNGLTFGSFATEIIRDEDGKFNRFRPVDSGTIYRAVKKGEAADPVRRSSIKLLEQLTGDKIKIDPKSFEQDEYAWIQAIDGTPKQAFSHDELIVYNLYPSTDVEHNGYPVTPMDTAITSITTHLSVDLYNKLYFQNGRATKGMMVLRSDDIDQSTIEDIKQQFNASINNVTNSFRTPIFGVGKEDDVSWVSTSPDQKNGEFEYLFDQTTRNILSTFNMSPDELPGFTHLSRGTNQQGLSEGSNEFKLIAARDTGIRPLILKIQDFLNEKLLPLIDGELAQLCNVTISGFDAETKDEESNRLMKDMPLHYDYDQVMAEVNKEHAGPAMGGDLPFNERYLQNVDKYITVGDFVGHFNDDPAAEVDPLLRYKRDQFWFQYLQMLQQVNPHAVKAYFATRSDAMDILKLYLDDYLTEDDFD